MRRAVLLVSAMVALGAGQSSSGRVAMAASPGEEVKVRATQMLADWGEQKYESYANQVAVDARFASEYGVFDRARVLADMRRSACKGTASLLDANVVSLASDVALLTYKAAFGALTCSGKSVPPHSAVHSSVWVRRDGKWLMTFQQETPLTQ